MASTTKVMLISFFVLYLASVTSSRGVSQGPTVAKGGSQGPTAAKGKPWLGPWARGQDAGAAPAPVPKPKYGKRSIARQRLKVRNRYCVPKTGTSDVALQKNIDYICKRYSDCSPIQPGGGCYKVNSSLYYRAAYLMHIYYNINERKPEACDFFGTGNVTRVNPTIDKELCNFK